MKSTRGGGGGVSFGRNSLRTLARSAQSPGRAARSSAAALLGLAVLCIVLPAAGGEHHKFVGVKKCKTCHRQEPIGDQYGVWLKSKHASAYETLASDKAGVWANDAGVDDPLSDAKCLRCHSTAADVPDELVSKKFKRGGGVECEACHGPGSKYRKKTAMTDPALAESNGLIPQSEKVCVVCHNDENRGWDPERYTRADGTKIGFDYEQAASLIAHPIPESYDYQAGTDGNQ